MLVPSRLSRPRLLAALAILSASLSYGQTPDVEFVAITSGPVLDDGTVVEYFLSFSLEGPELSSVEVFRPGDPPTPVCTMLQEGDNDWNCDLFGFESLNDICTSIGFGDFLIVVTPLVGSEDRLTVEFDPGCTDPFPGYAEITSPLPGGSVSPEPEAEDFCWNCSAPLACGPGDHVASIFFADEDVAVELLRDVGDGTCWDPGVCLPTGFGYEFEVSALLIDADFETRFTDAGDDFVYVSAFESQNSTSFDVPDPEPTGPPAVPDGDGASLPMLVEKLDAQGSTLQLFYDVESCCSVGEHHVFHGTSADLPASAGGAFQLDGSVCAVGATGEFVWAGVPAPSSGDFVWWFMVGSQATSEGSWGQDSRGVEREGPGSGGISAQCGLSSRDLGNACGR